MKPKAKIVGDYAVIDSNFEKLSAKYFGKIENNVLILDLFETYYLLNKNMIEVEKFDKEKLYKYCLERIENFDIKYKVFEFFRNRNYIVKSGTKYGFDFRIYEGDPEKTHARFLVKIIFEEQKLDPKEIIALTRVAHAAKKEVILAIYSKETDILFYKLTWMGQK